MFDDPSWWSGWPRGPWASWTDAVRTEFSQWLRMPAGIAIQQACAERYAADLPTHKYGGAAAQTSWDAFSIGHARQDEMPKFTGERWSPTAHVLSAWLRWWYSQSRNVHYLLKVAHEKLPVQHKRDCSDVVVELLGEDFERLLDRHDPERAPFHTQLTMELQFKARGWLRRAANRLPGVLMETGTEIESVGETATVDRVLIGTDETALLKTQLGRLSEGDAAILYLAQWKGLKGPEIAARLGIKPPAARKRLHDARKRALKAILRDHGLDVRAGALRLVLDPEPELAAAEYPQVRALIDQLPAEMNQILLLRFLPSLSSPRPNAKQVARELGLEDGPYRKRLCRARQALLRLFITGDPPPLLLALLEEGE
jgi:DNA-directed RNA polymerase specialized sigma24 family protein